MELPQATSSVFDLIAPMQLPGINYINSPSIMEFSRAVCRVSNSTISQVQDAFLSHSFDHYSFCSRFVRCEWT
jgi:hypothetical protein